MEEEGRYGKGSCVKRRVRGQLLEQTSRVIVALGCSTWMTFSAEPKVCPSRPCGYLSKVDRSYFHLRGAFPSSEGTSLDLCSVRSATSSGSWHMELLKGLAGETASKFGHNRGHFEVLSGGCANIRFFVTVFVEMFPGIPEVVPLCHLDKLTFGA